MTEDVAQTEVVAPLAAKFIKLTSSDAPHIDKLPQHFRSVIRRFANGETYAAIAAAENLPLNTVKSRINRGRRAVAAMREA